MLFLTIIPFFFAPGLSLISMNSDCTNMETNLTFATFGPSIAQLLTSSGSGTAFQQFTTISSSTAESSPSPFSSITNAEQVSTSIMLGRSIEHRSKSPGGTTAQQTITSQSADPIQSQGANNSSTIEAVIEIRLSDFVGTATVNLTRTDISFIPTGSHSSTSFFPVTTTENGAQTTTAIPSTLMIAPSFNSSVTAPLSNWTAGYNVTNGSFTNMLSPSPTALTIFSGQGTLNRHSSIPGMLPFVVFQIAVLSLV